MCPEFCAETFGADIFLPLWPWGVELLCRGMVAQFFRVWDAATRAAFGRSADRSRQSRDVAGGGLARLGFSLAPFLSLTIRFYCLTRFFRPRRTKQAP